LLIVAIYRFTVYGSACLAVFTFFTRRQIWSLKRWLERLYDLN